MSLLPFLLGMNRLHLFRIFDIWVVSLLGTTLTTWRHSLVCIRHNAFGDALQICYGWTVLLLKQWAGSTKRLFSRRCCVDRHQWVLSTRALSRIERFHAQSRIERFHARCALGTTHRPIRRRADGTWITPATEDS